MKANYGGFRPVIITLESQEEVDAVFAVCNHARIAQAVPPLAELQRQLTPMQTSNYRTFHNNLSAMFGKQGTEL